MFKFVFKKCVIRGKVSIKEDKKNEFKIISLVKGRSIRGKVVVKVSFKKVIVKLIFKKVVLFVKLVVRKRIRGVFVEEIVLFK